MLETIQAIPAHLLVVNDFHGYSCNHDFAEIFTGENSVLIDRSSADSREDYIQPIPYVVFFKYSHGARQYLAYTRSTIGEEKALHGKWSLGFGGHMREGETPHTTLSRELQEECPQVVGYGASFIGGVRDLDTPVGRRHIGMVFLAQVDDNISLDLSNEELWPDKSIGGVSWCSFQDFTISGITAFEPWSQFLIQSALPR